MHAHQTDVNLMPSKRTVYSIHMDNIVRETSEQNVGRRSDGRRTSPAFSDGDAKLVQIDAATHSEENNHGQRALFAPDSLAGSVLRYDEITVLCAIELPDRRIEVQLPRALFENVPKLGMPFSLAFGHEGGLRSPIVTPRVTNQQSLEASRARVKAIFDQL